MQVTAPAALLDITSPATDDEIDADKDLVIEWQGGSDGRVMITVGAGSGPREDKPGMTGERRGRRARHGRKPGGEGGERVVRETLESNSGTLTIPAAAIQALVDAGRQKLMIRVGQLGVTEFDHEDGTLHGLLRNGDRIVVNLPQNQ